MISRYGLKNRESAQKSGRKSAYAAFTTKEIEKRQGAEIHALDNAASTVEGLTSSGTNGPRILHIAHNCTMVYDDQILGNDARNMETFKNHFLLEIYNRILFYAPADDVGIWWRGLHSTKLE